jgi:hypothetical protein
VASNNCGASVAAGATCTVGVTFSPAATAAYSGTLTFNDDAVNTPQTVGLTGTGSTPVTVSPATLNSGAVAVGDTSTARTVTLTNHQNIALNFTGILSTAGFAVASNNCGVSIAAGATCTVGVTFSPAATGAYTGTLTFTDDAANSPQTVSLTGTGSTPVTLSATNLGFGTVVVGNTSAAKTLTLTNHENVALNFASILPSAGFAVSSNNCGVNIAAGATCTVDVTFSPATTGAYTGTLTFTDDAANSPQIVSLTGTGSPSVTVSPASLTLASTNVGTTTGAKTITLTNHLSTNLTVSGVVPSGDFAVASNTCGPGPIGAGLTCTVSVTFTPTISGARVGTLAINYGAFGSPLIVPLTGTGK